METQEYYGGTYPSPEEYDYEEYEDFDYGDYIDYVYEREKDKILMASLDKENK